MPAADPAAEVTASMRVEIKHSTMPPAMQEKALKHIIAAFEVSSIEKDVATRVKKKMDEPPKVEYSSKGQPLTKLQDMGTWHCIVGANFGVSVCFDNACTRSCDRTHGDLSTLRRS